MALRRDWHLGTHIRIFEELRNTRSGCRPVVETPNDSLTTTDCKESIMAKFDYIADSAPLPLSALVLQDQSKLADVNCPPTANPAAMATDATTPIAQLSNG